MPGSRPGAAVHSPAEDRDGRVDGTVAHVAPIVGTLADDLDGETLVLVAFGTTPKASPGSSGRPTGFDALRPSASSTTALRSRAAAGLASLPGSSALPTVPCSRSGC